MWVQCGEISRKSNLNYFKFKGNIFRNTRPLFMWQSLGFSGTCNNWNYPLFLTKVPTSTFCLCMTPIRVYDFIPERRKRVETPKTNPNFPMLSNLKYFIFSATCKINFTLHRSSRCSILLHSLRPRLTRCADIVIFFINIIYIYTCMKIMPCRFR